MKPVLEIAWRLVLSLWVGGIAIFTFLLTPAIFGHYGRDEAGRIVGVLFPLYFPYLSVLSLAALVLYALGCRGRRGAVHGAVLALLLLAVAGNAVNQFAIHPRSRAVKAEIHSFEAIPAEHPLRRRFARLHGVSMALNLFVLADGVLLLLLGPVGAGGSRERRETG